jgi:hypothetical protein
MSAPLGAVDLRPLGVNAQAVQAHLSHQLHSVAGPGPRVMSLPACPPPPRGEGQQPGGIDSSLAGWLQVIFQNCNVVSTGQPINTMSCVCTEKGKSNNSPIKPVYTAPHYNT